MKKEYGICHLCGKRTELSFEHVPPKNANNKRKTRLLTGKEIFNLQKLKSGKSLRYLNLQQGAGGFTLCKECNNNTGNWYANEYIKFVNEIGFLLTNKLDLSKDKSIWIKTSELKFQRIIKQVLCMFLSTIKPEDAMQLDDIREYVLNKESSVFDSNKYRINMYLLKNYEISYSGLIKLVIKEKNGFVLQSAAIMNLYPVGFILEINPEVSGLGYTTDITKMATLKYDECPDTEITFSITDNYSLHNIVNNIVDNNLNKSTDSMTELEEKCYKIAEKYHAGQFDKGGHPYIEHPVTVASKLENEIEKCVGLLHDIIEDTEVTYEMLLEMGVPKEVADRVLIMTHKDEESYEDYIKKIAQDEVTRKVKMADMEHNMDLSRIPNPTQKDLDRIEKKYKKWYEYLRSNL